MAKMKPWLFILGICLAFAAGSIDAQTLAALPKATPLEVTVAWDAPASSPDPVAGYEAFRAPSGSTAYAQINAAELAPAPTTYVDLTVQAGQAYDYVVESVDASGVTSSPSNTAVVQIPIMPTAGTLTGKTT